MANKRITALTETTAADPEDVLELDGVGNSRKIKVSNLVAATPPPPSETPSSGNFIKSGATFAHVDDLDIAVGAAEYYIQGVLYTSPAVVLTAAAADATNPRIDAVVLNSSNVAVIVTGTPAASPVRPQIDPATQLELTFITVAALATEPEINTEPIYLENTEWTTTASGARIDPDNTGDPHSGTKSIKFIVAVAGDNVKFVDTAFNLEDFELLTMWVTPVTWVAQKSLTLQCYLAGVAKGNPVSLRDGVFGLVRTTTTDQLIAISTRAFGVSGITVDEIRATVAGGSTGLTAYIDDIALQGGISAISTSDRLRDRGAYDVDQFYSINDLSADDFDVYKCIQPGKGHTPSSSATYWVHFATKQKVGSHLKHFKISFNPKAVCDGTIDRLFLMSVGPDCPSGLKIHSWRTSWDADPTTEADLDLKRADAFIGVANAAVMDVLDTTAGVSSETTASNINAGATVANGKVIYLEFGTAYSTDSLQLIFEMWYYAV
jgi:hypothetical protein